LTVGRSDFAPTFLFYFLFLFLMYVMEPQGASHGELYRPRLGHFDASSLPIQIMAGNGMIGPESEISFVRGNDSVGRRVARRNGHRHETDGPF